MKTSTAILSASLAALVAAAPTATLNKRQSSCAQYGTVQSGSYLVNNDLWGEDNGSGSQCFDVTGLSGSSLQWDTTWSWGNNPDDVKSYANAVVDFNYVQLSGISSMQSSWDWSYTGDSIVADVSYDLFTNSDASTTNEEYEIMIWLAALGGAEPIGAPNPIATTTIAGIDFSLYKGSNGIQTNTFSFVASEETTSFSGDINDFLTYLVNNQGFDSSQYLVSVGAGTEAITGSNAVFTTTGYSIDIIE